MEAPSGLTSPRLVEMRHASAEPGVVLDRFTEGVVESLRDPPAAWRTIPTRSCAGAIPPRWRGRLTHLLLGPRYKKFPIVAIFSQGKFE